MEFREGAGLLSFRDKATKRTLTEAINKSIYHNFRQSIPENVDPQLTHLNLYFVSGQKQELDKDDGYQKAKEYRQSLMDLVHKSWDDQQANYSPSKRTSFDSFCQKHVIYLEGVLPNTRQEWFEAMGVCQFTNEFVDDAKTGTRKMGKLILESVDWKKLEAWAKTEINFMKQWLKNNLGDDKGFLYGAVHIDETTPHIHVGLVPITKAFSKSLNQERYVLSNNRNFGGPQEMHKFHIYHANYLTKSGFEILPGEKGGKGSYNAASFREVKAIEKRRLEQEIESLLFKLRLEGEDYQKYQVAKQYQDYYEQRIQEVKSYLLLAEFNDFEKNQLTQYLQLLEKVKYYKIVNSSFQANKQNAQLLEHYQNELDIMTIRLENLLTKGYSLTI